MVQNNASLWKCLKDEMLSPQKNERHVFFFFGGGLGPDPKVYISYIYCREGESF